MSGGRALAGLSLLLLAQGVCAQDNDPEIPAGFFWHCTATMDGADGRFSGALNVEVNGSRHFSMIDWTGSRTFQGDEYGTKGHLRLSASWSNFNPEAKPFDNGFLHLMFVAERDLPKFGYFNFGEDPDNGTFVTSFVRLGPGRKSAFARLAFRNLKRWAAEGDRLHWRMQGGEDGVASGKWVTNGDLPMDFLPRLEADLATFQSRLLDKGTRPEAECEEAASTEVEAIVI